MRGPPAHPGGRSYQLNLLGAKVLDVTRLTIRSYDPVRLGEQGEDQLFTELRELAFDIRRGDWSPDRRCTPRTSATAAKLFCSALSQSLPRSQRFQCAADSSFEALPQRRHVCLCRSTSRSRSSQPNLCARCLFLPPFALRSFVREIAAYDKRANVRRRAVRVSG